MCSTKYEFDASARTEMLECRLSAYREATSNSLDRIYASCEIARQSFSDVDPYCHRSASWFCFARCSVNWCFATRVATRRLAKIV
jgi:hypothetical protein